jgi:hypothetical protein
LQERDDPKSPYQTENATRLALIPTLLPEGEGLENPSPCGRGVGVRAKVKLKN